MQHLRAVDEERRAAFAKVQPPRVHLRERRDERRRRRALRLREPLHFGDEITIREGFERGGGVHASLYHRHFRRVRMHHNALEGGDQHFGGALGWIARRRAAGAVREALYAWSGSRNRCAPENLSSVFVG